MKTIAFVPARCGSKSIPLKNIKPFCGKPLIYWVLNALNLVKEIDEVYVATDCDEIKNTVEGFGFQKTKVYMRNPENAQDHSSTESVMLEFINSRDMNQEDLFILVQATSPLTRDNDLRNALHSYMQQKPDSLLSCARKIIFLWSPEGKPKNYDLQKRPRRQEVDGELMENGAFYISTVGNILTSQNRLSGKIAIYEMPEYTAIDIDDDDDWIVGESLMKKHLLNTTNF